MGLLGDIASVAGSFFKSGGGNNSAATARADTWRQFNQGLRFQNKWNTRSRADSNRWNRAQLKFALRVLKAQQRQFVRSSRYSIRDRVRDAKKAGLHPLYALGASGTQGTASAHFIPGQYATGGAPTAAFSAHSEGPGGSQWDAVAQAGRLLEGSDYQAEAPVVDPWDVAIKQATLDKLRAATAREYSEARYADSMAARAGMRAMMTQDTEQRAVLSKDGHKVVPPQRTEHIAVPGIGRIDLAKGSDQQSFEDALGETWSLPYGWYRGWYTIGSKMREKFASERERNARKAVEAYKRLPHYLK